MSASSIQLTKRDLASIEKMVRSYIDNKNLISTMLSQAVTAVQGSADLMSNVHSLRWRVKDPDHLRDKLIRKMTEAKLAGKKFDISVSNMFERINDLAGMRILHLHTSQIVELHRDLGKLFHSYRYQVIEDAKARTWDDEYRDYYRSIGIQTVNSPKMYTSVHYVVSPNLAESFTCEIQVRTLAEELWGEVDHSMNYPHETSIEACKTQIRVLARVTSSCSRLVDSIYKTAGKPAKPKKKAVTKATQVGRV